MRARLPAALALAALAAGAVPAASGGEDARPSATVRDQNPCLGPDAYELRCPDLVMKRPFGLRVDRRTRRGRVLLRAGNSIDSVGLGPAELHGYRTSRRFMRAHQHIYRWDGSKIAVRTGARLQFKYAHLRRRWWKFHQAARFELWRVSSSGRRTRLVRRGPKVAYCLRDLRRTRPEIEGSPRRRVYPACNTNPRKRRVVLGTSIGWSDVYGPGYPEQWIDVTRLRGCFAYVHIADPRDGVYESNERNNRAQVIVRLPYRRRGARPCPGQRGYQAPAPSPDGY